MKGYAVSSARAPIDKVEVSADHGRSWHEARVTYSEGRWSWVLWEACIDVDVDASPMNERGDYGAREDGEGCGRVAWCRAWYS